MDFLKEPVDLLAYQLFSARQLQSNNCKQHLFTLILPRHPFLPRRSISNSKHFHTVFIVRRGVVLNLLGYTRQNIVQLKNLSSHCSSLITISMVPYVLPGMEVWLL